jgi:hypothetical protein
MVTASLPPGGQSGQNEPISDGLLQKSLSAEDLDAGLLERRAEKTNETEHDGSGERQAS